ncbi:MAG: hypothetical protein H8D43_04670 [Chloroflexi bacterium]|nr:hypothetical protein [Chloroflexota bacterium]
MDEAKLEDVVKQLMSLAEGALEAGHQSLYFDYMAAVYSLQDWQKAGMEGEMPVDLHKFGIRLPGAPSPAAEPTLAVEFAPEPGVPEVEARESAGEDEEEAQRLLEEGLQALEKDDLGAALRALREAMEKGSGDVAFQAETQLGIAQARLAERVGELLNQARDAKSAGDLQAEERAYREVLRLDPENDEARQNLARIARQRDTAIRQADVQEVRRLLTKPERQLGDIEEGLRKAEALLGTALDPNVEAQVRQWYANGRRERAELLAKVGAVETMAGMEKYAEAIQEYTAMISAGTLEIEIEGKRVATADRLDQLRHEYQDFCHTKADKYYDEAEGFLPATPKAAASKLHQALSEFEEMPEDDRTRLQARLAEINEMIERWSKASESVGQAINTKDPEQRLNLLELAREAYAEYESIEDRIAQAKADVASQIYGQVDDAYHRARLALGRGDYGVAENECMKARKRAREVAEASPELADLLEEIDDLLEKIETGQSHERDLNETADAIEEAIGNGEYIIAADLLAELPLEDRKRARLLSLEKRLARSEDITKRYNRALQRFQAHDWTGAVELCDDIINDPELRGKVDPQVEDLRKRAFGQQKFQEAIRLKDDFKLSDARGAFELAAQQDPSLEPRCDQYLEEIKDLEDKAQDVQRYLNLAKPHVPVGDEGWEEAEYSEEAYEKAHDLYEKASKTPSTLRTVATQKWLALRAIWRQKLAAQVEEQLASNEPQYEEAYQAITTLEKHNLLQREDHALALRVKRKQAERYEGANQWASAEKLWQEVVDLRPLDPEHRQGLQRARRQARLAQARDALLQGDVDKAIETLDHALREEFIKSDPDILQELIRICLTHERFAEAERYREILAIALGRETDVVIEITEDIEKARAVGQALTENQTLFDEGRYEQAVEILARCEETYGDATVHRRREQMEREATQLLLTQARELKQHATGAGLVDVIHTYQRVLRFNKGNRESKREIKAHKNRLPSLINGLVRKATRFEIGTRHPEDVLAEAETLIDHLGSFKEVVGYAEDAARHRRSLEQALRRMNSARSDLQSIVDAMNDARLVLESPTDDDSIAKALREVGRAVSRTPGVNEPRDLQRRLKKVSEQRGEVRHLLRELKAALGDDKDPGAFERVEDLCRQIQNLDPDDRFRLQVTEGKHYYPLRDQTVIRLDEHLQIARERKTNYEVSLTWYQRTLELYQAAKQSWQEVGIQREEGSLEDRIKASDACLSDCEVAASYLSAEPPEEPKSWVAKDLIDGAARGDDQQILGAKQMAVQIDSYKHEAQQEKAECEERKQRLSSRLRDIGIQRNRLRKQKRPSPAVLKSLGDMLLKAEELDPNNREVIEARREWQEYSDLTRG